MKTGSKIAGRSVTYVDAYAGRGEYLDGRPGSPRLILDQAAGALEASRGVTYDVHFYECDAESFAILGTLIQPYRAKGVAVTARHAAIADGPR